MPADLREATARAEALFHVDEPRWFSRADETPLLTTLVTAATERRRVSVEYRRRDDVGEFTVDPIGFVLKAGVWYMAARRDGEMRVYRVSRFGAATVTGVPFRRPPRFDLAAFWERSREEFEASRPRIAVRVRVARADVPALRAGLDPTVRLRWTISRPRAASAVSSSPCRVREDQVRPRRPGQAGRGGGGHRPGRLASGAGGYGPAADDPLSG